MTEAADHKKGNKGGKKEDQEPVIVDERITLLKKHNSAFEREIILLKRKIAQAKKGETSGPTERTDSACCQIY